MPNVIYLNAPARTLQPDQRDMLQYRFAQALLLKLNPAKSGDIALILDTYDHNDDLECVICWLDSNRDRLSSPFDFGQCYESLCYELNERMGHF